MPSKKQIQKLIGPTLHFYLLIDKELPFHVKQ